MEEYLRDPDFNPEAIRRVSLAASGLCAWAINIVQYYRVYCEVEPKRLAAEEATEQLKQTEEQFNATQNKLAVRFLLLRKGFLFSLEGFVSRDCKQHYKLSKININRHKMRKKNVNVLLIRHPTRSI